MTGRAAVTVDFVPAETTRALRQEVLRHGMPWSSTRFDGDDHPLAAHVAARLVEDGAAGAVVAVGTVFPEPPPWEPGRVAAWRIRGMATRADERRQGHGRRVLDALTSFAAANGGELIWCHARCGVLGFYRNAGFTAVGDTFDDGIAVHQSMWRPLDRPR